MVFVTGEAGIGKTALIDAFLAQVAGEEDVRVGRGQCIGLLGAVEAYLPLIEALGGLARRTEERALIPLLRRQAPTWLVQMPAFIEEAERDLLNRRGHGATPERMARELSEALEALTAESPLILWLEDLHWGDPSTVDLLAMLARRREPARLLVLGTYRPADVIASAHPLRALVRELEAHAQCRGLPLGFLTSPEVTRYLAVRFAPPDSQAARLEEWGRFIHRHTDGNPLFMVAMVDDLLRRGVIGEPASETSWPASDGMAGGLPESLRQLVDHQLEGLSEEERRRLEAASVAGMEFSAGLVAEAMGMCWKWRAAARPWRAAICSYPRPRTLPGLSGGSPSATASSTPSIHRSYTRGCQRRGGGGSIDGWEHRRRPPSVAAARRSPPSWPCISTRREMPPGRCTISGRRRRMRCGARPVGRRPTC
jgi:predicted ATPase